MDDVDPAVVADALPGSDEAIKEKVRAAERNVALVRVLGIAAITAVFPFLPLQGATHPDLALGVLVVGWAYAMGVLLVGPRHLFPPLLSRYVTAAMDIAFMTLFVYATGGYTSPYYVIWFVAAIALAFRFERRGTLLASAVYAASYVGLLEALGQVPGHEAEIGLRVSYIFLGAVLSGEIAHQLLLQARAKMDFRAEVRKLEGFQVLCRAMAEAAFEAVALMEGGRIVAVNGAFARLFGRSAAELIGTDGLQLVAPMSRARLVRERADASAQFEGTGLRADGTQFPAEVRTRIFAHEGRHIRVTAVQDLTERRHMEEAQRIAIDRSHEVERLKELDGVRTRFLNTIAHEMNTPLTPLRLEVDLLRLRHLPELSEAGLQSLEIVRRNVDRLASLVEDVLEVGRLQGGRMGLNPGPLDLNRVAEETVETFREMARDANVTLEFRAAPSVQVEADPRRITQVMFNLVANAIRFTPGGGRVRVETRAQGDRAEVMVRDTGLGLTPDQMRELFKPFSQLHGADPARPGGRGSGLGLYISKGLVELHGGWIRAESAGAGKGSTFTFSLPLHSPGPASVPASGDTARGRPPAAGPRREGSDRSAFTDANHAPEPPPRG